MDELEQAREDAHQATTAPDEGLERLTTALRAGLPGSPQGPGLLSSPLPAGVDPFEFFGSADETSPIDSAPKSRRYFPQESLADGVDPGAAVVDRRVAVMTQDMAAFGGVGREAPSRLEAPADSVRMDYFA